MCGILCYRSAGAAPTRATLERSLETLRERGPDARGLEVIRHENFENFGTTVLGHTRLKIIDLSAAADQPFWDVSGRHALIYNGELYNTAELRVELEAAGRAFRTTSDTEVLLEALLHFGLDEALRRAHGMYAFVWLDRETGDLRAARDPFGQKPLYYVEDGGALGLASNPAALRVLGAGGEPDLGAYSVFLSAPSRSGTRGVFQRDRSFFAGIHALPAGHVLEHRGGETRIREFFRSWDLHDPEALARNQEIAASGQAGRDALLGTLREHVALAVSRHLVSDVDVGVLLSGGFDSSLVYWFAHAARSGLASFTKVSPGIEALPLDVVPELLKRRPGDAVFQVQRPEAYLDGLVEFVRTSHAPSRWGGGVPMFALCRAARAHGVPVLLGGDGADEYAAGYGHYADLFESEPGREPPWDDLGELVSLDPDCAFYEASPAERFETGEREVRGRVLAALADIEDPWERYLQATLLHDTSTFLQTISLPHSDSYAMQASVELRNPLLDLDLVRFVVNLPGALKAGRDASGAFGKTLLRDLAGREIGPFLYREKEGTRNYSMRMADPGYWNLDAFALGELFSIPGDLDRRQMIRLFNLELFHRIFFVEGAEEDPLASLLSAEGRRAVGR